MRALPIVRASAEPAGQRERGGKAAGLCRTHAAVPGELVDIGPAQSFDAAEIDQQTRRQIDRGLTPAARSELHGHQVGVRQGRGPNVHQPFAWAPMVSASLTTRTPAAQNCRCRPVERHHDDDNQ